MLGVYLTTDHLRVRSCADVAALLHVVGNRLQF